MRRLEFLCRKLALSCDRYFFVIQFPRCYVVHEYDIDTQHSWSLGSFRRVADVERFLLSKFN